LDEPPIVKKINALDEDVRLYALNGFAIAIASEIENTLFWCYHEASGLSWEAAADSYYATVKFGTKRDKADAAIRSFILDRGGTLSWWDELNRGLQSLLGEGNSLRNLIGHNPVDFRIRVEEPYSLAENRISVRIVHEVSQSRAMVERRSRPPMTVGYTEMSDYCSALSALLGDLEQFAETVLSIGPMHPKRRDP
jgi:hypothetical protein